ncbi:MAG: hypothetical protein WC656_03250 [Sulfurimonas sp.]
MAKDNNATPEINFDTPVLTIADVQEQTRLYMEKTSRNVVEIAGLITGKRKTEPQPRMKKVDGKYTDIQEINEDGSPKFWDSRYYISLAFEGGEIDVSIIKEWDESLDIGTRILLSGRKGTKFGSIQDIYSKYTIL